ncbi:TetR/AcrR family transcriptional regulator [Pseudonocardia sp. HH130630-07]|uniref:TetR/AcrR family transcriptional regulator n=1 Tax=Pseudonocardia sp. HH130630-07 TaxID=1690815 RepID=UPI00081513CC|nr:TetR/AcrR family transcriptional regulator [Pseudonocardia sp. HH130630-07]ANY06337.1 hypothetical protein AFB00_08580 [Pseudonocardia sp. HH130630-07]
MSPAARIDARRSRARILAAARGRDVGELRLNEVARDAGVGVGTVYRHFPTVQALVEALSLETLRNLDSLARQMADEPDPLPALQRFLTGALDLQLADGGLQAVLVAAAAPEQESRRLLESVTGAFAAVLTRAQRDGRIRPDVTVEQIQRMLCGVEHAVRIGPPEDRALQLGVMLAGLAVVPAER